MRKFLFCLSIIILLLALGGCAAPTAKVEPSKHPALYTIKAPASGKIIGLIAEKGERIGRGQPLFAISDATLDAQVKELQMQVAKAEAELKRMEQGQTNAVPAGDLKSAQARVSAAQQKAAKMNSLLAQGAVSRQQAQAAQNELAQATAQLQAATQIVVTNQPASPEAKAAQQKIITGYKMQLAQALAQQQANEAASPCTGVITEIKVQNNATVEAEQEIIVIKEES